MKIPTASVLLIEDDEIDVEAIKRAFKAKKILNPIRVARDGVEGIEMLRGEKGHEPLEKPYIILLDINMPRMTGFEFLDVIRADPELKSVIIFILTTSDDDQDMLRSYERNVAGYIVKKDVGTGFLDAVSLFDHYWRVVELPEE